MSVTTHTQTTRGHEAPGLDTVEGTPDGDAPVVGDAPRDVGPETLHSVKLRSGGVFDAEGPPKPRLTVDKSGRSRGLPTTLSIRKYFWSVSPSSQENPKGGKHPILFNPPARSSSKHRGWSPRDRRQRRAGGWEIQLSSEVGNTWRCTGSGASPRTGDCTRSRSAGGRWGHGCYGKSRHDL